MPELVIVSLPAPLCAYHLHPKHGSWLNLIEGFFSKLARSVLRHIWSHQNMSSGSASWPQSMMSIDPPSFTPGLTSSPPDMIRTMETLAYTELPSRAFIRRTGRYEYFTLSSSAK
jgi:hypothetical protein